MACFFFAGVAVFFAGVAVFFTGVAGFFTSVSCCFEGVAGLFFLVFDFVLFFVAVVIAIRRKIVSSSFSVLQLIKRQAASLCFSRRHEYKWHRNGIDIPIGSHTYPCHYEHAVLPSVVCPSVPFLAFQSY